MNGFSSELDIDGDPLPGSSELDRLNSDRLSRLASELPHNVDQGSAEFRRRNLDLIPCLILPTPGSIAKFAGSKEVQVNRAGNPMLRILEMMIFAVGQRVAHVALAGAHPIAVVD